MKIVVFTASIGDTDALRDPDFKNDGVDYVAYVDRRHDATVWHQELVKAESPAHEARRYKLLADGTVRYDFSLWVDAAYTLRVDPRIFLPDLMRYDVLVLEHPFCDNIEEEATSIIRGNLAPHDAIRAQLDAYHAEGFDIAQRTHSSSGFLVRNASERTRHFNALWWEEFNRWGHTRDQMSMDYCAWRSGIRLGYLEGEYKDNPYATWSD